MTDGQLPLGFDGRSAPPSDLPPDQSERDRVEHDLEHTLFVEAGAGSGKTRALVGRVVALVDAATPLENIAAITFTEKAATELRQRVRKRLEELVAEPGEAAVTEQRLRALDQLDSAAICTLHAFAQRLLFEHPIEAGLPPGVEVLDELGSQVDFDERWQREVTRLLARDDLAATLLLTDVFNITVGDLRSLAERLEDDWDLVIDRLPAAMPDLEVELDALLTAIDDLDEIRAGCLDDEDKMAVRLAECGAFAADLRALAPDGRADDSDVDRIVDIVELLADKDPVCGADKGARPFSRYGNKTNWADADTLDRAKEALFEVGRLRDQLRSDIVTTVLRRLTRVLADFVLDGVDERRSEGRLRFHDLLVLARELLRSPSHGDEVRAALRERYRRLLIDEFQDTDPIQVELAALLAAAPGADTTAAWQDIEVEPGRLFFVGDPKQSIYRFRRADIATYLAAQDHFGGATGQVTLSTNFRSSAPVIDWVNHVFGQLIAAEPDAQPAYAPLARSQPAPPGGPGVLVLGADGPSNEGPDAKASELRRAEADDVAQAIRQAIAEQWPVRNEDGEPSHRPANLGDITVLLPARTSLMALERALETAGIPYRAETASLVYATPEIRTLFTVARAIDDPADELAVVAALRSEAFGCGDDDLFDHRVRLGGGWDHQRLSDELPSDHPVARGLRWMGALHLERAWLRPAQVLDRIVIDRRLMELGVADLRHREVWRRLRFVVDQARAWSDTTGGSLREYLQWVRLQASDTARVAETVLPETDTDAVRIMTIHGSKGLEFPITIVSGLTTKPGGRRQSVSVVWPPQGPPGLRLRSGNTTPEFDAYQPIDEQLDRHERLRLLYVACTRAADHLVVSLHRNNRVTDSLASVLAGVSADAGASRLADDMPAELVPPSPSTGDLLPSRSIWAERRADAIAGATRSRTIAATTLATLAAERRSDPALDKRGRNIDLPPWQKGRYGTAVGRAVHAVLQTVDLATGAGIEETASAQAAAEGVLGREAVIAALARSALATETVEQAITGQYWRELFVAAPVGARLLEGYVDLLYRTDAGLVVVDYKTDAWDDEEALAAKVDRYRIQTAAYAVAVETATGEPVVGATLLFLSSESGGAVSRDVIDLADACTEVRSLVPHITGGGEATVED